jgi:iron-sulfur cluster assembly protein
MELKTLEKNDTVVLTDSAAQVVRGLLEEKNVPDHGLRIFVSGGGCSGMQYGMALEEESRPYDHVIKHEDVQIYVDPTSMMYLAGSVVDYEDSLMGGGFRIDNPNAVSSCGCGHSFKTSGSPEESAASHGGGCAC